MKHVNILKFQGFYPLQDKLLEVFVEHGELVNLITRIQRFLLNLILLEHLDEVFIFGRFLTCFDVDEAVNEWDLFHQMNHNMLEKYLGLRLNQSLKRIKSRELVSGRLEEANFGLLGLLGGVDVFDA